MKGVDEIYFDVNRKLDEIINFLNNDKETALKLKNFKNILKKNSSFGRLMSFFGQYPYKNT